MSRRSPVPILRRLPSNSASDKKLVVPTSLLRYLWFCGLHFPAVDNLSAKAAAKRCPFGYNHIMAAFSVIITLMCFGDYIEFFFRENSVCHFFILVRFVNDIGEYLQLPIIMLLLVWSRKSINKLLRRFDSVFSIVLSQTEAAIFGSRFVTLALAWGLFWLSISCLGLVGYYHEMLIEYHGLLEPTTFLWFRDALPAWTVALFSSLGYILSVNAEIITQLYYTLLIHFLTAGFQNIFRNLQLINPCDLKVVDYVKQKLELYQKLINLTHEFNRTFGLLILFDCLRDSTAALVILVSLLKVRDPQRATEMSVEYDIRLHQEESETYWDYGIALVALGNALLRICSCFRCHSAAQKTHRWVRKQKSESNNIELQRTFRAALTDIDVRSGAISAGGVSYITMEYITGVFGTFLTYAVLVYQARDAKIEGGKYLKAADYQARTLETQLLVNNLTDLVMAVHYPSS